MSRDPVGVVLAVCLVAAIAGTVVIVTLDGRDALVGSGMGVLVSTLATALAWRARSNGKTN